MTPRGRTGAPPAAAGTARALLRRMHEPPSRDGGFDAAIRSRVLMLLSWNTDTDGACVRVDAHDGFVRLAGFVMSYAQKLAAGRLAENVAGVAGVENRIFVIPFRIASDEDIARAVRSALARAMRGETEALRLTVRCGEVTLAGRVSRHAARLAAADAAGRVSGVTAVRNFIDIRKRNWLTGR